MSEPDDLESMLANCEANYDDLVRSMQEVLRELEGHLCAGCREKLRAAREGHQVADCDL